MFQMKMHIFCAQAQKCKQKTFFSERFFISSWKMSAVHKKASMRNEGQGERNNWADVRFTKRNEELQKLFKEYGKF